MELSLCVSRSRRYWLRVGLAVFYLSQIIYCWVLVKIGHLEMSSNMKTFEKPCNSTGCNHVMAKPAMKCFCLDVGSIDLAAVEVSVLHMQVTNNLKVIFNTHNTSLGLLNTMTLTTLCSNNISRPTSCIVCLLHDIKLQ